MKRFVIGDIHGNYKALLQCLERADFDYENDLLIQLGDVVDGWSQTYECVEELLKIKNTIFIRGNHDAEFHHWILYGVQKWNWTQGAHATAQSYIDHISWADLEKKDVKIFPFERGYKTNLTNYDIPKTHQRFFENQHDYYIDEQMNCFVHGGFNRHEEFKGQKSSIYYWDRDLFNSALSFAAMRKKENPLKFKMVTLFKEVFIGHTATTNWSDPENRSIGMAKPIHAANIWNLDTGAGFSGKLTIMNVDTHEYWQSDLCKDLYPNEKGRD